MCVLWYLLIWNYVEKIHGLPDYMHPQLVISIQEFELSSSEYLLIFQDVRSFSFLGKKSRLSWRIHVQEILSTQANYHQQLTEPFDITTAPCSRDTYLEYSSFAQHYSTKLLIVRSSLRAFSKLTDAGYLLSK